MNGMGGERGITLVECLVTLTVTVVGVFATMGVFSEFGHTAYSAQRHTVLVSVAQREIEELRALPYAQLALAAPVPASAAEAPRGAPAESEALVNGGLVSPGPESFDVDGVTGRIYRYVTWRPQSCPALEARIATAIAAAGGYTEASVDAAMADLCPGAQQTKRLTVVVVGEDIGPNAKINRPVRLSSVAGDPAASVVATGGAERLALEAQQPVQAVAANPYEAVTLQRLHLTDTGCQETVGLVPTDHVTRSTALDGIGCSGAKTHDLLQLTPPAGSADDILRDYSSDVARETDGGLVLMADDRAGGCSEQLAYSAADEERRMRSVHTWATPLSTAEGRTMPGSGRANLTFWTATASGYEEPGRLCATVRLASTGEVLASADYRLPTWPSEPTLLSVGMDLPERTIPVGERLLLTLRAPSDSTDLVVHHDHVLRDSHLSLTMVTGEEFR